MNDQILTFLTTAGGLALGWTLNELSGYFKSGRERRQVLNKILFHQLCIRDVIFKTDVKAMERAIGDILLKELSSDKQNELREIISEIFGGFVRNELDRRFSSDIKRITTEYKNAMADLSKIDPYVTYRISGKDVVLDYLSYLDDYFNFVEGRLQRRENYNAETNNNDPIAMIRKHITPLVRESALNTIELDILLVARAKGYLSLFKAKHFIKKNRELKLDQGAVVKLEKFIENFSEVN